MKFIEGFFVGAGIGVPVFVVLAGVLAYAKVKHDEDQARAGWDLVRVLVVSKDLRPGDILDSQSLAIRSVPSRLATASVLRPESAKHVLTHTVAVPLKAGDPLLTTALPPTDECDQQLRERSAPSRTDASVEAIRERLSGAQTP
ncbi:hypothetical protein D7W79_06540 [Corallococcus exercitus]|uniref:SAF domain-containing protein n=1 Tax=Corallococcus exercitus TaxID=2316736 RepID=UPI000EA1A53A|nr:SAF domain-containing protein [Corallococcus exercitus]RKG80998.1 hypothetical protein D7W79_06540 [Corallococcus exercitus]